MNKTKQKATGKFIPPLKKALGTEKEAANSTRSAATSRKRARSVDNEPLQTARTTRENEEQAGKTRTTRSVKEKEDQAGKTRTTRSVKEKEDQAGKTRTTRSVKEKEDQAGETCTTRSVTKKGEAVRKHGRRETSNELDSQTAHTVDIDVPNLRTVAVSSNAADSGNVPTRRRAVVLDSDNETDSEAPLPWTRPLIEESAATYDDDLYGLDDEDYNENDEFESEREEEVDENSDRILTRHIMNESEDATVTVSRAEWRKVQQQVSLLTAIVAENARKFTSVIDTTNTTARRIEQLFAYLRIGGEKSVTVNLTSSFKSEVRRRLAMLLDWCDLYPGKAKMFALLNDIPPPIGLDAIDLEVCKKQVLKYCTTTMSEHRHNLKELVEQHQFEDLNNALQAFNGKSGCERAFPPGMFAKLRLFFFKLAKEGKIGTKSLSALTMYRDFLLEFKNMQSDARKQEQRDAIAEERLAWEEHIASNTRGAGQKKKRRELMPTLDQLVQAQTGAAAASTSAQAAHRALSGVIDTIEGFD